MQVSTTFYEKSFEQFCRHVQVRKDVINSLKTYSGREVMSRLETCSGQKRGYEQFNDIFGSACEVRTV